MCYLNYKIISQGAVDFSEKSVGALRLNLIRAVEDGDCDTIQQLVNAGVRIDDVLTDTGDSMLALAAFRGHVDVVRYLVNECGVDVSRGGINPVRTPLFIAARAGHVGVVRCLVNECGADVNLGRADLSATPLLAAAQQGHVDVVRCLALECGADVNLGLKRSGETPLIVAAFRGHLDVVRCLALECGADVNLARTDVGSTPLYVAAQRGHLDVVRCLVQECGADVNLGLKHSGETPLYVAALQGYLDIVRFLVNECGADVHQVRKDIGGTPVFSAAAQGHEAVVRFLVNECGADIHQVRTVDGDTPLLIAARGGHLGVVRFFVNECGVDVNVRLRTGATSLFTAAALGHAAVVRCLLSRPDIDGTQGNARTPFQSAANARHRAVMLAFMAKGLGERASVHDLDQDWFEANHSLSPLVLACLTGDFGFALSISREVQGAFRWPADVEKNLVARTLLQARNGVLFDGSGDCPLILSQRFGVYPHKRRAQVKTLLLTFKRLCMKSNREANATQTLSLLPRDMFLVLADRLIKTDDVPQPLEEALAVPQEARDRGLLRRLAEHFFSRV